MANVINTGGGATVTMLSSLTNVPTSNTAISGTENWKNYDAIQVILFSSSMQYDPSWNTYLPSQIVLTNTVTIGYKTVILWGGMTEPTWQLYATFKDSGIVLEQHLLNVTITEIKIYGINF